MVLELKSAGQWTQPLYNVPYILHSVIYEFYSFAGVSYKKLLGELIVVSE
jgi:hypothetical protein